MIDSILQKIDANHSKLENLVKIGSGMQTGANDIFVFKEKPLQFPTNFLKKRLSDNQIEKYAITPATNYLLYFEGVNDFKKLPARIRQYLLDHKTRLANRSAKKNQNRLPWWNYTAPTHKDYYNDDKLWCSSKNHKTGFAYDDTREYVGLTDTMVIFDTNQVISLKYLLALLNSSLLTFRYQAIGQTSIKGIGQLPIVLADKKTQQRFTTLVDYILYLKKQPFYRSDDLAYASDYIMVKFFEQILDGMVYELYLPADLHQGKKYFLDILAKENLPPLKKIKGDKMNILRTIFELLFDKEHQIRKNIFYLDGLPIIRIIEGKLCELRELR
jgi:hypothetical protein